MFWSLWTLNDRCLKRLGGCLLATIILGLAILPGDTFCNVSRDLQYCFIGSDGSLRRGLWSITNVTTLSSLDPLELFISVSLSNDLALAILSSINFIGIFFID